MTDQDWARKIGALLRKAEGTDNENEASAFLAKAQELMIVHAIDEQALRESQPTAQRQAVTKKEVIYSPDGKNAVGKAALYGHVARAMHCRFYRYGSSWNFRGSGGPHARWGVLVGFPSDIEAAEMMYASLLIQGYRYGTEAVREWGGDEGRSRFLTGFLLGFAIRVGSRLRAAEETIMNTTTTALIVRRDAEVDEAVKKFFGSVGEAGGSYTPSGAGMSYGWAAAGQADLGQTKVAAGAARLHSGKGR